MSNAAKVVLPLIAFGCMQAPEGAAPKTGHRTAPLTVTNGLEVNGLEINGLGTNGLQVNGFALNGVAPNGIKFNGLELNGLELNGLELNGLELNGLELNGLELNGLELNGVSTNGVGVNGLELNGLELNGLELNGLELNGLELNGLELNGMQLNTVLYGAQALNLAQKQNLDVVMAHLVKCALPAGDSVTVTGVDGASRTYAGQRGFAPEWKTGAMTKHGNESVRACIASTSYGNVTQQAANVRVLDGSQTQAKAKKLLKYLIQCALSNQQSVSISDEPYAGVFGLATEWANGPLSNEAHQKAVSACIAARTNPLAKTVQISIRGLGIPVTGIEKAHFGKYEGAFWGNLFSSTPSVSSCQVMGGGISGRVCTDSGTCGFQHYGQCKSVCTNQDLDGNFYGCGGETEVIATYLPFSDEVSFGLVHTCIKQTDGGILCWGNDTYGQIGTVSSSSLITFPFLAFSGADSVALGDYSTCAHRADGTVWCWGSDIVGELGIGFTSSSGQATPLQVTSGVGDDVAQVRSGRLHSCAIRTDGTAWCWGWNSNGQLGNGNTVDQALPAQVSAPPGFVQVSAGYYHTCGLRSDGTVLCWGMTNYGPTGSLANPPALVLRPDYRALDGVTEVATGKTHSCALRQDGTVYCWGDASSLGIGDCGASTYARPVVGLARPAKQIVCLNNTSCALLDNGEVECWGDNGFGQLGIGGYNYNPCSGSFSANGSSIPIAAHIFGVERLFAGREHVCARRVDGTTWCWGYNQSGQLGDGTLVDQFLPVRMSFNACGNGVCDRNLGEDCSNCAADCKLDHEICDGYDNNCDGQIDEGVTTTFYRDADGDGYGDPRNMTQSCSASAGYVANSTDCDDTRASVHPGAAETCNGLDDNCNGVIDEGVTTTFYRDADSDGYGNASVSAQACSAPVGYVANSTDCNDANGAVNPGHAEVCGNGIDDNCNGTADEGCIPAVPTGLSPASSVTVSSPGVTLTWAATPGATTYWVNVWYLANGSWVRAVYSSTSATSFNFAPQFYGNTVDWQVEACNSTGCSAWTSWAVFNYMTVPPVPTVTAPAYNASVFGKPVTLRWNAEAGAYFRVSAWYNNGLQWVQIVNSAYTSTNSYALTPPYNYIVIRFQIDACTSTGCSAWSPLSQFYFYY